MEPRGRSNDNACPMFRGPGTYHAVATRKAFVVTRYTP
jgi:hypothetical protein